MAVLINGKKLAEELREEIKADVSKLKRRPGVAVIIIGDDPASQMYVRNKKKDCMDVGILSREFVYPRSITEEELLYRINKLNQDEDIDGILIQLPIPAHIDESRVIRAIDPSKDVDCFHPYNVGEMLLGEPGLWPCTPSGIMQLLKAYNIDVAGKNCVVVGRSNIVGKPMGLMMLREDATVTFCHSKTENLAEKTSKADILISAVGQIGLIRGNMVKEGAVVIDVAMNRDPVTKKFSGDVVFDEVEPKASFITPVPGGVGPMTRTVLLKNIVFASKNHQKQWLKNEDENL